MLFILEDILGYSDNNIYEHPKPEKKRITLKDMVKLCAKEIKQQSHQPRQPCRI